MRPLVPKPSDSGPGLLAGEPSRELRPPRGTGFAGLGEASRWLLLLRPPPAELTGLGEPKAAAAGFPRRCGDCIEFSRLTRSSMRLGLESRDHNRP